MATVRLCSRDEIKSGEARRFDVDGHRIALVRIGEDFYAIGDRCSHQDFPLSDGELNGDRLECIYHGATFDVCTGRAMQLPAIRPVKTFPVEVRGGDVFVEV